MSSVEDIRKKYSDNVQSCCRKKIKEKAVYSNPICIVKGRSFGFYISINSQVVRQIVERLRGLDGEHIEVCVNKDGTERAFTFNEFLERLGFNE